MQKLRERNTYKKIRGEGRTKNQFVFCFIFIHMFLILTIPISIGDFCSNNLIYVKQFTSRLEMTEDEVILHFFEIDGNFCYFFCELMRQE